LELIGNTALILVDVQRSAELDVECGIPLMPGGPERVDRARQILAAAREAAVPPIFIQEVHKRTLLDFGRELDGSETVHCLEGDELTELASGLEPRADEYHIRKRRYSAFFATELELVLKSLGIETVVLLGGLTDVCVHYTFADAHQHDYHCKVVTDATGGSSPEAHEASLRAMRYLQRDCLVTTAELLSALGAAEPARVGV
jgi:nicotinamidase-related amidase